MLPPPFASDLLHANFADRGITQATGVSAIADFGTSGTPTTFVQGTGVKQPTLGVFTAKPAVVFDGVADSMSTAGAITLSPYTATTWAFLVQFTGGTTKIVYETSTDAGVNAGAVLIYESSATSLDLVFYNTGPTPVIKSIGALTAGTIYRVVWVMNTVAAGVTFDRIYVNGSNIASTGVSDRGFLDTQHFLGARNNTSGLWAGKFGARLIYNRALSVGEIATVDAYLASLQP